MPKRKTNNAGGYASDDNPIGLTGAFAPVRGPQSVDYDAEVGDNPVGLTQAFGAIPDEEREPAWNDSDKWKGFDWSASYEGEQDDSFELEADDVPADVEEAPAPSSDGEAVRGESGGSTSASQRSGESAAPRSASGSRSGRGRHAAPEKELSPRMKKSQRTRRVLIVLVIILLLVVAAVVFFGYRTWTGSQQEAAQQAQEQTAAPRQREGIADAPTRDAAESTAKLADVPNLANVIGKSQDEAITMIGRGALVTSNNPVDEEGNPIKANLTVKLTDEPADSKSGTPTVYLGLTEDGKVCQAGYSASASALGFGSLSFADAVNTEHVVEKTLGRIGVSVPEGTVTLPANKDEYSTYASDGTTVVRERSSFEGGSSLGDTPCTWSSVLSYDYTTQVVTGNLNDTVRIIYAYITV